MLAYNITSIKTYTVRKKQSSANTRVNIIKYPQKYVQDLYLGGGAGDTTSQ